MLPDGFTSEERYKLFGDTGATNIKEYNSDIDNGNTTGNKLPYIIFVFTKTIDFI